MTAATLTLADFLLARIAEDESRARRAAQVEGADFMLAALPLDVFDGLRPGFPNRVLAECAAKRAIVDLHAAELWSRPDRYVCYSCAGWDDDDYEGPPRVTWPCSTVRTLAAVFADHPDFDPSWRA